MSEMFSQAVSTGLMGVLAEAAAGYPNSGNIFFTATLDPGANGTYNVSPPHAAPPAPPAGSEVFGPFSTPPPFPPNPGQGTVAQVYVTPGPAAPPGVLWSPPVPPPPPCDCGIPLFDGTMRFDAMFCSLAAVLKFAVPYYTMVYSPEFADTVVQEFLASDLGLMVHMPWSEYGTIDQTGRLTEWLEHHGGDGGGSGAGADAGETAPATASGLWSLVPVVFRLGEDGKTYLPKPVLPPRRPRSPLRGG